MRYIINKAIGYRPADGTLWNLDNEAEILTLSPTSNRLLSVLLTNRSGIISRDELLKKTWDDYGLVSSNNSLNHYISALRKKFLSLGVTDEIIKTEPKMGFHIPDTVDIQCCEIEKIVKGKEINYNKYYTLIAIILCTVFVFASIAFTLDNFRSFKDSYSTNSIGRIEGCELHPLKKVQNKKPEAIISIAEKLALHYTIKCEPGDIIYFSADNRVFAGEIGKAYFSLCETINRKIHTCTNYLVQDWK